MTWQPLNLTGVCPASTPVSACSSFGFVYLSLLMQMYGRSADQRKQEMCDRERKPEPSDGQEYDFIVVGAGAAGCVVANRLTENPEWKVLLLEAGPEEPDITQVPGLSTALVGSSIDWKYVAEPNGKSCLAFPEGRCAWPRGKSMGGTTAINAMEYVRGNPADYDRWASLGNKGWSYKQVLPYFIKSECNMNKYAVDSEYHGAKGEQYVSWFPYVDEPASMMTEAYNERGVPFQDMNGDTQFTAMQGQAFSLDGERVSSNAAFIRPIRHIRTNLFIKTNSEATKILIDSRKNAYGIEYFKDGKKCIAYSSKEIIVSAGTANSPKLLMLSGIGPKAHLKSINIPVIQDLAVGENLQDHASFTGMIIALPDAIATTVSEGEILRDVKEFSKMKIKRGPLSGLGPLLSAAFIKTEPNYLSPDIQYQATQIPNWREYIQDPITSEKTGFMPTAYYDAIMPRVWYLATRSKGKVLLNKNDPHGPPSIHANYLDDYRDVEGLLRGIRFLLTLENTEAFKSRGAYFVREKLPHCAHHEWGSDDYFVCIIKQYTTTCNHHVGTCKMGPKGDKNAVVDNELRVYGVKRLRVMDASVMPNIVRGNTQAPTLMIGERGVDFLIKYWQNHTNNYCFRN